MRSARPAVYRSYMLALALGIALIALSSRSEIASAVILPATTLDGPSQEIVGFGGAAMAEDGTGGVVYLKRVDGVAHIFVSRYLEGHWLAPMRVDVEMPFAASWPRIAAANGGELLVVWATPFATDKHGRPVEELVASELAPGSASFSSAIIVDPDINEGTGASPALAMSSTGQADVVYRVIEENEDVPALRPGDVVEQVRVARYDGLRWSKLGPVNRNLGISMRPPTQANAPQVAIGPTGNGIVVWQEPDAEGVARIWARRIFGSALDYVLPVTLTSYRGATITDDADAPAVAFSHLGQAEVAYRQNASAGSPLPGPRIFLNVLPDGESTNGSTFAGAAIVDEAVAGGKSASVGRPSLDIDEQQDMRLVYDSNGTPRVIEGTDRGLAGALSLGPPVVGSTLTPASELPAASVMDPAGGGISAWTSVEAAGNPAVAVREDFPEGAVQTGLVSGGAGGPIGELAVGRSSLGDGIVAFQQGPLGNAAIVAAQVSAPPFQFIVSVPKGWTRPSRAVIGWQPAPSADGPLRYTVVLDGRRVLSTTATSARLSPQGLGSGSHRLQVLATDIFGASTLTPPSTLKIDAAPPTVQVTVSKRRGEVHVRVSDRYSGVKAGAVSVSFGDGHGAKGRARLSHRYARAGIYTVVVHVSDKLGVAGVVRKAVSVR